MEIRNWRRDCFGCLGYYFMENEELQRSSLPVELRIEEQAFKGNPRLQPRVSRRCMKFSVGSGPQL